MRGSDLIISLVVIFGIHCRVHGQACTWDPSQPFVYTRATDANATFNVSVSGEVLTTADRVTWKLNDTDLSIGRYSSAGELEEILSNPRGIPSSLTGSHSLTIPSVTPRDNGQQITVISGGCTVNDVSPAITLQVKCCNLTFYEPVASADADDVSCCGYNCVRVFTLNSDKTTVFNATCLENATWDGTVPSPTTTSSVLAGRVLQFSCHNQPREFSEFHRNGLYYGILDMSKPRDCESSTSYKLRDISRYRRRASQTKHRHQVASCYQRLRKCIPDGGKKWRKSCGKRKTPNKVAILQQSKDYILHLESVLLNLLHEKKVSEGYCRMKDNAIATALANFTTVEDFRAHFDCRFDPQSSVTTYFNKSPNTKPVKWTPRRKSSQNSEDLGFVSEEGSQDKCSNHSGLPKSKEPYQCGGEAINRNQLPSGLGQYNPYMLYPNGPYLNSPHFLYYVPAVGYPAPFYNPCGSAVHGLLQTNVPKKNEIPVSRTSTMLSFNKASNLTPPGVDDSPHVPSAKPCGGKLLHPLVRAVGGPVPMPQLEMHYSYSKPDGKMSPPKICVRGLSDSKSPPTLLVMEKSKNVCDDGSGEYYSCLLPNPR